MESRSISKDDWNPSNESGQWQRRLFAGENMWLFRPKEVREMFLGGVLSLSSPIPREQLLKAISIAWCLLRLKNPEIACSFGRGNTGYRYLRYQAPSNEELGQWAAQTIFIEKLHGALAFPNARRKLCQQKSLQDGACLHLSTEALDESCDLTAKMGVVFNMDHMYTDGIGIRILAGQFFGILSRTLASTETDFSTGELDFNRKEIDLSIPYTSLMNVDQKVEGRSYNLALIRQREFLLELVPKNWGLPALPESQFPRTAETKNFFHSFTAEDSELLLRRVKEELGPPATINHLAHAAMVVAMLRAHPPPLPLLKTALYSPSWIDGRKYLQEGHRDFIPNCRAMGEVVFPRLEEYLAPKDSPKDVVKASLKRAWKAAFESYQKIREQKSLLSESIPLTEYLGDQMASGYSKAAKSSAAIKVADPFFLGDGMEENHINRTYQYSDGNDIFSIEDLKFAANAEGPNIIVRLSSWRDALTLSGEWLDTQYDTDFVNMFLRDIVELMLLMIED